MRTRPRPIAPLAIACSSSTGSSRLASSTISTPSRVTAGIRRSRASARRSRVSSSRRARYSSTVSGLGSMMTTPSVPSISTWRTGPRPVQQRRDREHGGQPQRTRQDRGMAVRPAELGRETADPARVHQRRIAGRDLLRQDDRAAGQARIRNIGFLQQIADQPGPDHPDVVDAGRQIRDRRSPQTICRSPRFRAGSRARR